MEAKLKNITISIPEKYDKNLAYLKENGIIQSRSDGIRQAVQDLLDKDIDFFTHLEEIEQE